MFSTIRSFFQRRRTDTQNHGLTVETPIAKRKREQEPVDSTAESTYQPSPKRPKPEPTLRTETKESDPELSSAKPTLLTLPAEIKNEIHGYAVTSSNPVLMRVVIKHRSEDRRAYRVKPELPGLVNVCRETRSFVPSLYYARNTFYFTDDFFHWNAFEALRWLRGRDVKFMERVMV